MEKPYEAPLYNSRIVQTYIDYLKTTYPGIQTNKILQQSGMKKDEVADPGHWFTQDQVNRFHEVIATETGDEQIARHAGRFMASARGIGLLKRYVIGLMSIETVFESTTKLMPLLTKGATLSAERLGLRTVEIISKPNAGVHEKPFQCENRWGIMEALPRLFTNNYADIEHPQCFHRGDPFCRYIVRWNTSPSIKMKWVCNYSLLVSTLMLIIGFFILPAIPLQNLLKLLIGLNLILLTGYFYKKSRELEKVIEFYHETAEEEIESVSINYNNALLVQEIGQATAAIFDIHELMNKLVLLMQRHLPFGRGLILLSDEAGAHLEYSAGYGYDEDETLCLKNKVFNLNKTDSQGAFTRAFLDQEYIVVNDINSIEDKLSAKSRELAQKFDIHSFLCVPILFKKRALGILAVDNIRSSTSFKKSDVNLLQGIASHIAISINNSRSFQKLKESEAKYRQTLESISEGYFEINPMGALRFVNKALCELLDYTFAELIDSPLAQHFYPDNQPSINELFESIQKDKRPIRFAHFKMIRENRDVIPVDLSASLVLDTNGCFSGFRGLIRDATDRLKIENEKKLLENQLLHAQKMEAIGTLAGGIAHNFNNWLSGILGNAALIRFDSKDNEKINERISKIDSIVESAARMTQQLLGYARGGKYKVDLIDINEIINESADTFSAARKDISFHLNLDRRVYAIKADKSQIEQVLWNLYANAVDAMPNGGNVVIETRNTIGKALQPFGHHLANEDFVCLSITDTGIGIDPKYQKNIFEPFFTTKEGKGTGLGLASAYGIIKSHGGYIDVKSSFGKGSTFYVFLPRAKENFILSHKTENIAVKAGHETILLVDDDNTILDTCGPLLSELGYTALTALNGEKALEIYSAKAKHIDLVIIDMIMPGMSGKELYTRLRELNPSVKALLSSGYSLNEQVQEILDSGCNGFIQKPYDIYLLSDHIRKIVVSDLKN